MSKGARTGLIIAVVVIVVLILIGLFRGNYNRFVTLEEDVNQKWAQVQNVYQRRYDLIPNLVETVRGYAKHERETLEAVTEARSKVGGVTELRAEDLTPENMSKFQEAQASLSGALQRLMVVVEQYPNLKANEGFVKLQDQLEQTENRITVERNRFNESVQTYNRTIRQFPANLFAALFGFAKKVYFEAAATAQEAPKVQF